MANLAVISGLAGDGDLVALDKLCHASLIDGARLSGAEVRVYPHLHTEKLVRLLSRHQARHPDRRRLVVTDSVFSMDGDVADLQRLAGIADDHNAALIIDEAHATGIFGQRGSGMVEAQHVSDSPHISISTASKAMGCLGGMIAGPRCVIDTLVNRGRSFIYTTAPPATQVAAIDAALSIIESQPQLRERLMSLTTAARQAVADAFPHLLPPTLLDIVNQATPDLPSHRATPILPLVVGTEVRAMSLTMHMVNHDLFAPAIRPPTVPPGQARVRISLRADHPDDVIARLMAAIRTWPDHTS